MKSSLREILEEESQRLATEIDRRRKAGQTIQDVLDEDPFLGGQVYVLGMIGLELFKRTSEAEKTC